MVTPYGKNSTTSRGTITQIGTRLLCPIVAAATSVDAVEVVRCKDCKYSCKDGNGRSCEGYWYELSEYDVTVKDDDFCSYGEGKDYD